MDRLSLFCRKYFSISINFWKYNMTRIGSANCKRVDKTNCKRAGLVLYMYLFMNIYIYMYVTCTCNIKAQVTCLLVYLFGTVYIPPISLFTRFCSYCEEQAGHREGYVTGTMFTVKWTCICTKINIILCHHKVQKMFWFSY